MIPYKTPEECFWLICSSQLTIPLVFIMSWRGIDDVAIIVTYFIAVTSILHWRHPVRGYIRMIDITMVFIGFIVNLILSYNSGLFALITYLSMVFGSMCIYTLATNRNSSYIHSLLHMYGFIALNIQYWLIK
jgi:hypothetical protein